MDDSLRAFSATYEMGSRMHNHVVTDTGIVGNAENLCIQRVFGHKQNQYLQPLLGLGGGGRCCSAVGGAYTDRQLETILMVALCNAQIHFGVAQCVNGGSSMGH